MNELEYLKKYIHPEDNLEEAIKRYRENDTCPKTTKFTKESFDHLQEIMIDYGALDKKVPYSKLIYNEK